MSAVMEFFFMGGHALFVWPAYAITATGLLVMFIYCQMKLQKSKEEIAKFEANDPSK